MEVRINLRRETRKQGREQDQQPDSKASIQRSLAERGNQPRGKKAVTGANCKEQVGVEARMEVQAALTSQAPECRTGLLIGSMSMERMGRLTKLVQTWH